MWVGIRGREGTLNNRLPPYPQCQRMTHVCKYNGSAAWAPVALMVLLGAPSHSLISTSRSASAWGCEEHLQCQRMTHVCKYDSAATWAPVALMVLLGAPARCCLSSRLSASVWGCEESDKRPACLEWQCMTHVYKYESSAAWAPIALMVLLGAPANCILSVPWSAPGTGL